MISELVLILVSAEELLEYMMLIHTLENSFVILDAHKLKTKVPDDAFIDSCKPVAPVKDPELLEYLEKKLGGGRVPSQKQFLDNDRKVLRFFTDSEDLQFIWHYFLADDTVEIREVHFANDGRDSFSVYLRR